MTTGSQTAIPRQRSLEATIDWSYQLLNPSEQIVLERLAVFAGGFSPDAAEEVCADEQLPRVQVVPTLFSLVEKSLIRHGTGIHGGARYSMFETIRKHVRNKLAARGDSADVERRHAVFLSTMASSTEAELRTARQVEWLAQLDEEHDNFRTAIEWALEREPLLALEIVTELSEFWARQHIGEGTTWVTRAMAAVAPTGELRARALELAGTMANMKGDFDLARALFKDATEQWAQLGNWGRAGHSTEFLGLATFHAGDHKLAFEHFHRAVELLRPLGEPWYLAGAINDFGFLVHQSGDSLSARALLDEALQLARQSDDPYELGLVLNSLAEVELSLGLHNEARAHEEESLELALRLDNAWLAGWALAGRARLALVADDPELCIRLMAASEAAWSSIGAIGPQWWSERVDTTVMAARRQLSDPVANNAWGEGKGMTIQAVIASVLKP
jgi:non-specific serine/threonine protein kinase